MGAAFEVVQLLPAPPHGRDQVGGLQDPQVFAHRLAGHGQPDAQLAERLALPGVEAVEQLAPAGIGQRLEHLVHVSVSVLQPSGCRELRQPLGCMSRPSRHNPGPASQLRGAERGPEPWQRRAGARARELPGGDYCRKVTDSRPSRSTSVSRGAPLPRRATVLPDRCGRGEEPCLAGRGGVT